VFATPLWYALGTVLALCLAILDACGDRERQQASAPQCPIAGGYSVGVPERATLYLRPLEIELYCTDPLFVNPLLTTLVDEIGYYGLSAYKLTSGGARRDKASSIDTPVQDVYYWRLYGIDGRSQDAWWLIVQRFTKCGWELLGPSSVSREQPRRVLVFSIE
jgi:hypothetical protein